MGRTPNNVVDHPTKVISPEANIRILIPGVTARHGIGTDISVIDSGRRNIVPFIGPDKTIIRIVDQPLPIIGFDAHIGFAIAVIIGRCRIKVVGR